MKSQSAFKSLVIPASLEIPVAITGSSFYLEAATGAVDVQFDEGGTIRCKAGQTIDLPPGDFFKQIIFRNPDSSSSLTIQYYAGTVSVGTRTPYVFTKPAPTYFKPFTYTLTSAADTLPPIANTRAGKTITDTVSHVILSNNDVVSMHIRDAGGTVGLVLPAGSIVQLTVTDQLYLRSAGANITVRAMVFFNYDS